MTTIRLFENCFLRAGMMSGHHMAIADKRFNFEEHNPCSWQRVSSFSQIKGKRP